MGAKRIISDKQKAKLAGCKDHKGKDTQTMSDTELRDLIKIIAEKLGLL